MPYRAKKPCAFPGCKRLTSNRYCHDHSKEIMKNYNKHKRDPSSKNRYGKRWREVRASFLDAHPLCDICEREGRLTPADCVHHIKPLSEGGNHHWKNLQALCTSCHSRIHAWGKSV